MDSQLEDKEGMKKTIWMAFFVLLVFFGISKLLSAISSNPAQQSYERHCAGCHGVKGEGLKDLMPPLANSDWLVANQDRLACILKNGIEGELVVNGKKFNQKMDGVDLNEIQLYNIINYINTSWGNDFPEIRTVDVEKQLENCEP